MCARARAAGVLILGALLAGCGGGEGTDETAIVDPVTAVSEAASETFESPTSAIELATATEGAGSFEADGIVELSRGRFEADVQTNSKDADYLDSVIGTNGEGFERTFAVNEQGVPPRISGPCWFNPHAPVGSFLGTISVEESARLTGAMVESMASGEIASAQMSEKGEREFLVVLSPSANRSRDESNGAPRRVWGARELLREPGGPIRVVIGDDGALSGIEILVKGYRSFSTTAEEDVVTEGVIEARLAATDQRLEIRKPSCQAIE